MVKMGKKTTGKKDFYLEVLLELQKDTNLTRIRNKLNLSKQSLNYYLTKLKGFGYLEQKGNGWYEITEKGKNNGKNMTKYSSKKEADTIRGHAYIWEIELNVIPTNWKNRIKILENSGINFKLVGALKNTPRIKVLGRKIWLCNDHLRIFDIEKASYYGNDAKESKLNAKLEAFKIIRTLENKLNISLTENKLKFKKEHYAIIKNDLAKHHNKEGVIMRISDKEGEWLLIDDSLGFGGELETIGKKAYSTNLEVQNWWNDNKKHKFEVTPSFLLENINKLTETQLNTSDRMNELMLITKVLINEIDKLKNGK